MPSSSPRHSEPLGAPVGRRLFLAAGGVATVWALAACSDTNTEDSPLGDTTLSPSGAVTAPPSEASLPLELSGRATWPPQKDTVTISQLVGRYVVFATSPKAYQARDVYVTGVAAVDGSAGWLLVVDPATGEVSTVQVPADGEPELPEPADDKHPGKALDVLATSLSNKEAFVLVSVSDVPAKDVDDSARVDLLKIGLVSGEIVSTLSVATGVRLSSKASCHLDLMSEGSLSVYVGSLDKPIALVVDPSAMTRTMDAWERLGATVANDSHGRPLAVLGVSAWGVADATAFYPATSWAQDAAEWKEKKG